MNCLAEAGKLSAATRFHETWPINYAPDAGTRASKWKPAKELYQKLACGKDATLTRVTSQVSYENTWTRLVVDCVRAALLAKHNAQFWVDEKIKNAKARVHGALLPYGRTKIECSYYFCQDGQVIIWPAWAERSKRLPNKLTRNNWKQFLLVVRELVRIYFLTNERRMREYLKAALPREIGYDVNKWDSSIFNAELMDKVEGALRGLAFR